MRVWDKEFVPYISKEKLHNRVQEMGKQLTADYEGEKPVFISILNGAFMFTSDLLKETKLECEVTFAKMSSYEGTESTGTVRTLIGVDNNIKGKHVIIVEDIVDTGRTMKKMIEDIEALEPASIKVVTLLSKPDARVVEVPVDYVGFEIDNLFVVGYGLDYDELGRNIDEILIVKE
ncbi:hypoxanthine phosphoribosyltransferase [Sediminitomix flava]|uniref:Hypoxanthine phosphoribosyltransferase n=1 Tax=Sediminitomix flava TaxID=379075 RepID=A0A315ZAL8_SEDFL|nr:hypoxanthine phosphoribosyltransferase [Sediminitomix flava]PWJ42591.1 hypoxanthine phosphoribosyltransferase [Sediminitomix flava]